MLHYVCLPVATPASCLLSSSGWWAFYQPCHRAHYLGCNLLISPIMAITRQQSESLVSQQGVIRRFGRALDVRTRLRLYNAFIKPCFMFYLPVWSNASCGIISQMDNVITRHLRAVTNNNPAAISNNTFSTFDIGRFRDNVFLQNFFSVFHDLQFPVKQRSFNCESLSNSYDTRDSESRKLLVPMQTAN